MEQATLFLSNIRKKKRCRYVICTDHSHILTSHLTAGQREDANTSYLTSSRQSQPSPPSLPFPPLRWNRPQRQTLWSSVPATRLRYLRPPLPAIQLPQQQQQQQRHTNTAGLANHSSSREVLANKKWGEKKAVKSLSETPLHKIFLGFPAALKSCLSLFMFRVQSQEANVRSPQSLRNAWLYQFWENPYKQYAEKHTGGYSW